MSDVVKAKVQQAVEILRNAGVPLWIAQFARETHEQPSPVQELVVGTSITWPAAFLIAADGSTAAIVGTGDVANVQNLGGYDDVIGYVADVGPPLVDWISRLDPATIAVSYSVNDESSDGITHGMFIVLERILAEIGLASRLASAEGILVPLRARKLPLEVERITSAIAETLDLFNMIEEMLVPGVRERQISDAVHEAMARDGLTPAWDTLYDPVVNFGPRSPFGHARPSEIELEPGMLAHVDLGVKLDGYCSDLQRMWYLLRADESEPPAEVARAFDAVVAAMGAGFDALKPGVPGWQVDAAARDVLVSAGFPAPEFSLGHQLGQTAHDGGALLGPRWPRYGNRPDMLVEQGNVFTLEYAVQTTAGIIGLEEDVVVGEDGASYLTPPQTELWCLRR